jgi:cytochrome c-type biogenesis protein CcmH
MILFIFAIAALMLVTLFSLLRPWWRRQSAQHRAAGTVSLDTAAHNFPAMLNTTIHRNRLAELERDYQNGAISSEGYAQAQEELQRQLLEDVSQSQDICASGAKSWRDGLAVSVFICVLATGLYFLVGNPAGLTEGATRNDNAEALATVNALIAKLETKMQQNPDNPEGWAMLARGYALLGRWDDAERALGRIGPTLNQDASLLADLAEILAKKNGTFVGRPDELILQALQLEPDNGKALYLAGAAAFEKGQHTVAVARWEQLKRQIDPQSDIARNVVAGIAKAREMDGVKVGAGDTAAVAKVGNGMAASGMMAASAISGRVMLSPALHAQTTPDETVFIFARAVNGSRMPLAVQRARVADLPLNFHLDDTMAISPENKISMAKALRVEARVSKSGQAMPASGDLTGSSARVTPGTKGIEVVIDQVVK